MKVYDVKISTKDIEMKVEQYNATYNELITRKNILSRVISNCNNKNEDTLI